MEMIDKDGNITKNGGAVMIFFALIGLFIYVCIITSRVSDQKAEVIRSQIEMERYGNDR